MAAIPKMAFDNYSFWLFNGNQIPGKSSFQMVPSSGTVVKCSNFGMASEYLTKSLVFRCFLCSVVLIGVGAINLSVFVVVPPMCH